MRVAFALLLIALLIVPAALLAEGREITCDYPDKREDGAALERKDIKSIAWFRTTEKLTGRPDGLKSAWRWNNEKCRVWVKDIKPGEYFTPVVVDTADRWSDYAEPYHHNIPKPATSVDAN